MFKIFIKEIKAMNFFIVTKYLVIFLLMIGLIGDLFFSPSIDIKIHLNNFIIGSLIFFICWLKSKDDK